MRAEGQGTINDGQLASKVISSGEILHLASAIFLAKRQEMTV
jgi:hypothetical protein